VTTIEQLKSQLKICQNLSLTADVERLQQQLDKLASPTPALFTTDDISKLSEDEQVEYEPRTAIMVREDEWPKWKEANQNGNDSRNQIL
jgi:hypothetical protein